MYMYAYVEDKFGCTEVVVGSVESLRQRGGWVVGFLKRRDEQSLFLHTKMSNVGGG